MEEHDVVVIGAGVMGLASAWALARAGREVRVLEQFAVGHPYGSSHGEARIFRFAYDEPEWVALAQEALPLWRELEAESGQALLSLTGLLDTSPDSAPLRAALDERGATYELLDPRAVERRFGLVVDGEAVLELHGGTVRADQALAAFHARTRAYEGVVVHALHTTEAGVRLDTSQGVVSARVAVVAAGAWAAELLAGAGIELPAHVTRETIAYFRLPHAERLPSVIDWQEHVGRHAYSLASGGGVLKVGLHHSGVEVEPGEPGAPDATIVEAAAGWVRRRFPTADPEPFHAETCLYTSLPGDRFALERHGAVVVCSACSGHGFKFAPAVGVRVAALAA